MNAVQFPPARDRRTPSEIGRSAALELGFGVRHGRTVLLHSYAEPPLRAGRGFETPTGLHFVLASSAPGLFGGDRICQTVRVDGGARVLLTSQSALQMHPSASGAPASIVSRYVVAAEAELQCVWNPSIPFAGAAVEQRCEIDVAPGGRLFWSDAMMSGREGSGERWQFKVFEHEVRVRTGERLAYLERYRIEPSASAAAHRWAANDAAYVGTMLRVGYGDGAARAEYLHGVLAASHAVSAAADVLEGDVLLVRIASSSGVAFHRAREVASAVLAGSVVSTDQNR